MAYPNYGYVYNYGPGYLGNQPQYPSVNSQYMTNPYQNIQPPQPTQAVPNTIIPPTTNKRLCISQEDAMSRQVENNSSYVYFDQNKDIMYEVNTDGIMLVAEETDVMEITMKNASKMRMRNTSWKYKMVGVE